ncbi:negative regulator of the PHO system [Sporothrix eucalyptigena]
MDRDRGPGPDGAKDIEKERDRLVAALRLKLSELDARVVAYRRDRADEFRRYAVDLLAPLSDDAVAAISVAMEGPAVTTAESCPALYPGFVEDGDEKASSILSAPPTRPPRRSASPPPVLYHTSGTPKDGPRRPPTFAPESGNAPSPSLHARDNDFRGVFTPPFLPLLDSWSYDRRSDSGVTTTTSVSASDIATKDTETAADGAPPEKAKTEEQTVAEQPAEPVVEVPPPEPKLKSALRRTSSISSSRSSTRSSTPVNTFPNTPTRHVRFSFNGEEVLPTSSPPREQAEQDLSWLMHDNSHNHSIHSAPGHSVYDYSRHYQATAGAHAVHGAHTEQNSSDSGLSGHSAPVETVLPKEAEAAAATSFAAASPASASAADSTPPSHGPSQGSESTSTNSNNDTSSSSSQPPVPRRRHSQILDDDEEEFVPLSRRISSSDRLRALSKMPLEDPSNWTVVNPQADSQSSANQLTPADLVYQPPPQVTSPPSPPLVEQHEYAEPEESDASSSDDEDGFVMRATRKTKTPQPAATVTAPATNGTSSSADDDSRPKYGTSHMPIQVTVASPPKSNGTARGKKAAADDDDFFDFEPDSMNGDDDDEVGYPLSRVTDVNTFDDDDDEELLANVDQDENLHDEDPVEDAALVEKEKSALGIGKDGLDAANLVFNRKAQTPQDDDAGLSASLLTRLRKAQDQNLGDNDLNATPSEPLPSPPPISAGSYRGKSIDLFNVVKDPRILQQAAQMGNLNSFVGSIHDRETQAPASLAEFSSLSGREQLNLLSGTPRSLTERMVMEDTRKIFSSPR